MRLTGTVHRLHKPRRVWTEPDFHPHKARAAPWYKI